MKVAQIFSINNANSKQNSIVNDTTSFGIKSSQSNVLANKALSWKEKSLLRKNGLHIPKDAFIKQTGALKSIYDKDKLLGDISLGGEYGGMLTVLKRGIINQSTGEEGNITRTVRYNVKNPNLMKEVTEYNAGNTFFTHVLFDDEGKIKKLMIEDPRPFEIDYNVLSKPNTISKYWMDKFGGNHTEFYTRKSNGELTPYVF